MGRMRAVTKKSDFSAQSHNHKIFANREDRRIARARAHAHAFRRITAPVMSARARTHSLPRHFQRPKKLIRIMVSLGVRSCTGPAAQSPAPSRQWRRYAPVIYVSDAVPSISRPRLHCSRSARSRRGRAAWPLGGRESGRHFPHPNGRNRAAAGSDARRPRRARSNINFACVRA